MSQAYRILRVSFESREELEREYRANLVNGGLFIPGPRELLYGEAVLVFVELPFVSNAAANAVQFDGRVVQSIPVDFDGKGARNGVAIELANSPEEIRGRLEGAIDDRLEEEWPTADQSRYAQRTTVNVRARVYAAGVCDLEGRTRNLSLAGVLVAISESPPAVGQEVTVEIVHATTGEAREIPGVIARHDRAESGRVRGLGIQFRVPPEQADETMTYLHHVKASEHARRLGGITGSLSTLGLDDLLVSFGMRVPRARFILMNAGEVGLIQVESGLLMSAQLGSATGIKALVRLAAWESGDFEFHSSPDDAEPYEGEPLGIPITGALLEAARLADESRACTDFTLPRTTALRTCTMPVAGAASNVESSKLEQRILDMARTGATVGRLLDTIQEPDSVIEAAIARLVEQGSIRFEMQAAEA